MKKINKFIIIAFFWICFLKTGYGQFNTILLSPNYGNTNANIIGVGIGNWPAFGSTNARFHVNNFYCNNPNGALSGSLFRTDGDVAVNNTWSMLTGATAGTVVPRFSLSVPANTSNLRINTPQANSSILLNANGNNMLRVTSAAGTGNHLTGQVLIQPGTGPGQPDPRPLMDIGGTIKFSENVIAGIMNENILMYGYTTKQGNPNLLADDGFRIKYQRDSEGTPFTDCLIFEKTDGINNVFPDNDPDGCTMFTNTGDDGVEELAIMIEGTGHVGVGHNYTQPLQTWRRFNVFDSLNPQMRLHHTHSTAMFGEIFTDFETTTAGNLNIDPRNAGLGVASVRSVMINYGLGNPAPYPNVSLDINGQENIRTVNQDDALNQVLVWEPVTGNVRWRDANTLPGTGAAVTADNGCSINPVGNVRWGNIIGGTTATLLDDREIPMDNWYTAFSKSAGPQQYDKNSIVIGTSNSAIAPQARLEVIRDLSIANVANGNPIGLRVENTDIATGTPNVGVSVGTFSIVNAANKGNYGGYFIATSPTVNNTGNIGVQGVGINGVANWGIYGEAIGTNSTTNNYGGEFIANTSGASNYGGKFYADQGTTLSNAIYTESPINAGINNALYVNGDATLVTGTATGFGSDSTMKTNFNSITNATNLLEQINTYTFNYNTSAFPTLNLDNNLHYGVVAQNIQNVVPDLVSTFNTPEEVDSLGNIIIASQTLKSVKYTELIPILIAGFNEQQNKINSQDSTIAAMQQQLQDMMAMINNCCSQGNSLEPNNNGNNSNNSNVTNYNVVHSTDVRLTDNYCVLGENSPNPFRDHTIINFNLSQSIQSAQIVFYNMLGEVIKVLPINDRGEGRLNVYGEDLRSGMYTYSLVIDGNICETKKMIKE